MKQFLLSLLFVIALCFFNLINVDAASINYTVTFDIHNGKRIETKTVQSGYPVTKIDEPTRDGYTFGGWYIDNTYSAPYDFSTPVTSDITLYAKWNINTYILSFNTMGGTSIPSQKVSYRNRAIEPPKPVKKGYYFGGWFTDDYFIDRFSFLTEIKSDRTVYALWLKAPKTTYDVTFVPGLGVDPFIVEMEREGYLDSPAIDMQSANIDTDKPIFGKWYTDEEKTNLFDFDTPITSDLVLYGKWTLEDGTEVMETPDTGISPKYIYYGAGTAFILLSGFVTYSYIRKNKKTNLNNNI